MAKVQLYTLFDLEAGATTGPILQTTRHAAAVRSFQQLLETKDTLPHDYPHHFQLLHIGALETDTGEIMPVHPTLVIKGQPKLANDSNAREVRESAAASLGIHL